MNILRRLLVAFIPPRVLATLREGAGEHQVVEGGGRQGEGDQGAQHHSSITSRAPPYPPPYPRLTHALPPGCQARAHCLQCRPYTPRVEINSNKLVEDSRGGEVGR